MPITRPRCSSSACSINKDAFNDRRPASPNPSTIIATMATIKMLTNVETKIAIADNPVAAKRITPRRTFSVNPATNNDPSSAPTPIMLINMPSSSEPPPKIRSTCAGIN